MASERKQADQQNENSFDFNKLGHDYGVSLKFDLNAADYVNKQIDNDIMTEKLSSTKWKFHFHDDYETATPQLYNKQYCWNFEKGYLQPITQKIDDLKAVTLSDDYSYVILVHWKDITTSHDNINKQNQNMANNPHSLNVQNHSIQQAMSKTHKKIHHWRIPLRARITHNEHNKISPKLGPRHRKTLSVKSEAYDKS